MAWNQPGNNGQDRDPWGSGKGGNSDGSNQNNNSGGRQQGPANVDDLFNKFNQLLGKLLNKGGGNSHRGGSGSGTSGISGKLIGLAVVVGIGIWGLSGFYTIKEGEVGVITRFGKNITGNKPGQIPWANPGLNWRPMLVDKVVPVNIALPRKLASSGIMLTADENVVNAEMNVIYQVVDPSKFLFSVTNSVESLSQATDSALRAIIGKYTLDRILTDGRTIVSRDTKDELEKIIGRYDLGININSINFQQASPPREVQAAFNDAISAREDEQRFIVSSVRYTKEVQPEAQGRAQRLLEDARAYKEKTVLEAEGEVAHFKQLLPEYQRAPDVTRQRLYLETMGRVLGNSSKVLIDSSNNNNLMVLPLDQLTRGAAPAQSVTPGNVTFIEQQPTNSVPVSTPSISNNSSTGVTSGENGVFSGRSLNVQRGRE